MRGTVLVCGRAAAFCAHLAQVFAAGASADVTEDAQESRLGGTGR
jgi:hypothetical protein